MNLLHGFGILCFLLSIWMVSSLNGAIRYRNSVFPCEAGCASSQPCFATAWAPAANVTKTLTSKCPYVLYSVSLGPRGEQSSLHAIADYWGGRTCSLFLLGSHSKSIATHSLTTGSRFRNWTVVIVDDSKLFEQFGGSLRRAAKVVKMSPHMFLHANVRYAVFVDAKLQVLAPPRGVIHLFAEQYGDVILAAVHHPFSQCLHDELRAIRQAYRNEVLEEVTNTSNNTASNHPILPHGTGPTDNLTLIELQVQLYKNNSVLTNSPYKSLMIEGAYQVIHVHDRLSIQFRCAWLNQIQQHGDRDQISFPYVLAHMAHEGVGLLSNNNNVSSVSVSINVTQHGELALLRGDCAISSSGPRVCSHPRVRRVHVLRSDLYGWFNKARLAREVPRVVG